MEIKLEHVLLFLLFVLLLKMIMDKCGCKGLVEGLGVGQCEVSDSGVCKLSNTDCCGLETIRDCNRCKSGYSYTELSPGKRAEVNRLMGIPAGGSLLGAGAGGLEDPVAATEPPAATQAPSPPAATQAPSPATQSCSDLRSNFCNGKGGFKNNKGSINFPSDAGAPARHRACCKRPQNPAL